MVEDSGVAGKSWSFLPSPMATESVHWGDMISPLIEHPVDSVWRIEGRGWGWSRWGSLTGERCWGLAQA